MFSRFRRHFSFLAVILPGSTIFEPDRSISRHQSPLHATSRRPISSFNGTAFNIRRRSAKSANGSSSEPKRRICSVSCWQSISSTPKSAKNGTAQANAIFDASGCNEHRFAIKHPADLNAVKTARQPRFTAFIGIMALERMRVSHFVQLQICRLKLGRNPSPILIRARRCRTMRDHFRKTAVDRNPIAAVTQRFRQRARNVQTFGNNHRTRADRIPKKPTVPRKPRKHAIPIRLKQPPRIQIPAHTDQPFVLRQCTGRIGERIISGRKQRNTHISPP